MELSLICLPKKNPEYPTVSPATDAYLSGVKQVHWIWKERHCPNYHANRCIQIASLSPKKYTVLQLSELRSEFYNYLFDMSLDFL